MRGNELGSECLSLPNSLHPLSEHLPEGIEKNGNHVNTIAKKMHFPHSFCLYPLGGMFGALPLLLLLFADGALPVGEATLSFAVAEAVVPAVAVAVAVLPATCAAGCSSQWNGSKVLFGSTQLGFLEA